jgi:hypothetical protein
MKYVKLFESFEPNFKEFDSYLYHGTSDKNLNNILEKGILNKSCWGSESIAFYYAECVVDEIGGNPILIKMPFKNFADNKFEIDWPSISEPITTILGQTDEELIDLWSKVPNDGTWLDCLNIFHSVIYKGDIYPTEKNIIADI